MFWPTFKDLFAPRLSRSGSLFTTLPCNKRDKYVRFMNRTPSHEVAQYH